MTDRGTAVNNTMSVYLTAWIGKSYTNGINNKTTGKELVELAGIVIEDAQYIPGGVHHRGL